MANGLLDAWGRSVEQQKFASQLIEGVNKDIFGISHQDYVDPEKAQHRKGLVVQTHDKDIGVFTEFEGFDVSVWMEDDRDIMIQLYPPRMRVKFPNFELFLEKMEKPFARVLDGVCNVAAEFYPHNPNKPHRVSLGNDKKRRGMDLLELRCADLYKKLGWKTFMIDVLKECQTESRRLTKLLEE